MVVMIVVAVLIIIAWLSKGGLVRSLKIGCYGSKTYFMGAIV